MKSPRSRLLANARHSTCFSSYLVSAMGQPAAMYYDESFRPSLIEVGFLTAVYRIMQEVDLSFAEADLNSHVS